MLRWDGNPADADSARTFDRTAKLVVGVVLAFVGIVIAGVVFATMAEAQNEEGKWYYTTDCPYDDNGDDAHAPCMLSSLEAGENIEVIVDRSTDDGFYVVKVCATTGRHAQIIEDDNKLGSTLENTRHAVEIRSRFAGIRSALQQEHNKRLIAGQLPQGQIDPLELIHEGGAC